MGVEKERCYGTTSTIFLTLSSNDKQSPELLQTLYKFRYNKEITREEALELPESLRTELIRNDPVMCARYFDYKINRFMKCIKKENSVFDAYRVMDSYERVEFQMRGSPHEHILLWLRGAPAFDMDHIEDSEKECVVFIDRFITCKNDAAIPIIGIQNHKHTRTCYKSKGKNKKCRFKIPLPMMRNTQILHPLEQDEERYRKDGKENYTKIHKRIKELFAKPDEISFDDILNQLELSEQEYLFAIRSSLKKSTVFLKRGSMDIGINAYNREILQMFESNMDIQFILNEFAVASYIVNYISKIDSGLSKLLRQAVAEIDVGNLTLRERFRKISNVFNNGLLLSAQEAVYLCLSMPLSKSSRNIVFINTGPKESRVHMLKSKKIWQKWRNMKQISLCQMCLKSMRREKDLMRYALLILLQHTNQFNYQMAE